MTDWHVDEGIIARYAGGRVPLSVVASVEAHLQACSQCRALLAPVVERDRLEQLWGEVAERVDTPRPGVIERLLRLARVPEDTARLLAVTPTLRAAWLLAMAAALTFAAVAALVSGENGRGTLLFLTLAPVLPVAGVAAAFHRSLDPTYEIGLAAPSSQFRLLLLRSVAVTAVTCLAALMAGLMLPQRTLTAAAWLLPAFALTSLTLVLARRIDVVCVAAGVGGLWAVAVASAHIRTGEFVVFGVNGQLAALAVTAASLIVLIVDRDRYAARLGGA
jgi:predicted anti-sigma-YlaC factor YlaD